MPLIELERQTIVATLRNGLGLTRACNGIQKHPSVVSEFIKQNPSFSKECYEALTSGYQLILLTMNDSMNTKNWGKWKLGKSEIEQFISKIHLWQEHGTPDKWSFELVTLSLRECQTISETATALGMEEMEFRKKLFTADDRLVIWMVQNGYQI